MRTQLALFVLVDAGLRRADKSSRGPFDSDHPRMINPWGANKPFRFLDDMFPVAPEDSVGEGAVGVGGTADDALVVPPYAVADPFPQGSRLFGEVRVPGEDPVVVPRDPSYGSGDYFPPKEVAGAGGIVAPASKMPEDSYPLLAPGDDFSPMPALGPEDSLPRKYARYFDQVEDKARGCDTHNGYVTNDCTVACGVNETVQAVFGNELRNVTLGGIDVEKDVAEVSWDPSLPADAETGTHGPVTIERRRLSKDGKVCAPTPAVAGDASAALLATGAH